ncbi:MAG: HNH endonuclease, partial [Pseudomonadota bacterium]
LSYRGRQVLLYIQDHGSKVQEALLDPESGKKYHVSECKTIHDMRNKGRFERYVVTNDISGEFHVTGYDYMSRQPVEGNAALKVCKNCLKYLNYKGYSKPGNYSAFMSFDLDEFFQTYSSFFSHHPRRRMGEEEGYTRDWAEISRSYRQSQNYKCEKCSVSLINRPQLLHVHHVDGVKSDNRLNNLKALCADCHSKEAFHEGMYVSHSDRQSIMRLRQEQHFDEPDNWQQVMELADSGLRGFIEQCRAERLTIPEVGLDITDVNGEVKGMLELAWRKNKVGIAIDEEDRNFAIKQGWKIFSVHGAIDKFYQVKEVI